MNGVDGLHRRRPELVEGFLDHDLPYLAWGSGPPLVYLRGFSTTNANPTGMQRSFEVRMMQSLSQQFHVHAVTRPAHLPADVTMADIATWHADAILDRFDGPVHVLGVSLRRIGSAAARGGPPADCSAHGHRRQRIHE